MKHEPKNFCGLPYEEEKVEPTIKNMKQEIKLLRIELVDCAKENGLFRAKNEKLYKKLERIAKIAWGVGGGQGSHSRKLREIKQLVEDYRE